MFGDAIRATLTSTNSISLIRFVQQVKIPNGEMKWGNQMKEPDGEVKWKGQMKEPDGEIKWRDQIKRPVELDEEAK